MTSSCFIHRLYIKNNEPTSAAPSAAFFSPQPSLAQRSAVVRSLVIKKLSKKMSEVMDQSSSPTALNGVILNGCRSSKYAGLGIFLGFQTPWKHKDSEARILPRKTSTLTESLQKAASVSVVLKIG